MDWFSSGVSCEVHQKPVKPLGVNLYTTVGFLCVLEVMPHVDVVHVLCTVSINVAGWYLEKLSRSVPSIFPISVKLPCAQD